MPTDKDIFNAAAILTAARIKNGEATIETVMEVFDETYDCLDCYRYQKKEREPFVDLAKRLQEFYGKSAEETARHPRWHQPLDL